jgi:peptidoglycan/xylan/chitin deacetylase (PgdA/CDA1 family)
MGKTALFVLAASCGLPAQDAGSGFRWPEGKRVAVSFSFDDARLSQVDTGLPLFDKHGAKATFYVSPRSMMKRLDGWKKAVASGHEIGNHSNSHPCSGNFAFSSKNALEDYTVARMEEDLDDATAEIVRELGVKPETFAYPCGLKFIGRGVETKSYVPLIAKRFLVGRGWRDESSNDPLRCDLAHVMGIESDSLTFEQMKNLTTQAAAQGRWLVFAGHEIGKPGSQTTLAASLDEYLPYAKDPANGIWLDTVKAVGKYVRAGQGK